MIKNSVLKHSLFYIALSLLLIIAFFIQFIVTDFSPEVGFFTQLKQAYIVNAFLAFGIYFVIGKVKGKKPESAGFVFMLGSGIKFFVFFSVFYPVYKEDGDISRLEFATFFVPYTICLVSEVYFLSRILSE